MSIFSIDFILVDLLRFANCQFGLYLELVRSFQNSKNVGNRFSFIATKFSGIQVFFVYAKYNFF